MERPLSLKPLSIQDENSAIHRKKMAIDGKSKTSKPVAKKGGPATESRKALNDITNKSSIKLDATSQNKSSQNKKGNTVEDGYLHHHVSDAEAKPKKKSSMDEKLNVAEESFLHDHSKCIQAQRAALELNFRDIVLPGHDSGGLIMEQAKSDPDTDSMCELEELSMSEFSDWYKSPLCSPIHSPPSPFAWDELEPVELMLKGDDHDDVSGQAPGM
ncbi:hypothetical protein CDL12_27087 [Handroanthus impetiginosus]|uniref:Uncharacterized protein n=1 Tax=Handroanthus impetiginosus TaxID=429701 RepID=A0A2G9G518_9LAMI|nr:hypothetical protein CDL12_27087 [Handroanthus impetiginosus]